MERVPKKQKRNDIQDHLDAAWDLYRQSKLTTRKRNQIFTEIKPYIDIYVYKTGRSFGANLEELKSETYVEVIKCLDREYIKRECSVKEFTRYLTLIIRSAVVDAKHKVMKLITPTTVDPKTLVLQEGKLTGEKLFAQTESRIEWQAKQRKMKKLMLYYIETRLSYKHYIEFRQHILYEKPLKTLLLKKLEKFLINYTKIIIDKGVRMRRIEKDTDLLLLYLSYNSLLPDIYAILPEETFYEFLEMFGGQTIYIPEKTTLKRNIRDIKIWTTLNQSYTEKNVKQLALHYEITPTIVKNIFKKVEKFFEELNTPGDTSESK